MAHKFPDEWRHPFQLACYCSWLREFYDAQEWLKQPMAVDDDIAKQAVIDDPDRKRQCDSTSGALWKREHTPKETSGSPAGRAARIH